MSKTANGRITGTVGNRFAATFILRDTGTPVNILGHFSSSVEGFASANGTLSYDDVSQLTETREFDGKLGVKNTKLTMAANGPVIEGFLDEPVFPASTVSGSDVWTMYK